MVQYFWFKFVGDWDKFILEIWFFVLDYGQYGPSWCARKNESHMRKIRKIALAAYYLKLTQRLISTSWTSSRSPHFAKLLVSSAMFRSHWRHHSGIRLQPWYLSGVGPNVELHWVRTVLLMNGHWAISTGIQGFGLISNWFAYISE